MNFTNLIFLLGTLAILGPLLAHLWAKPKYRRIPFTMIRFLQIGQIQNQSKQNLKNLLILLLRCACIVLIAMLFAGPRLLTQAQPQKNSTACYLALDDSLSMAYRDGSKSYFDTMIERTKKYIASAPEGCSFNLYALASGKNLTHARKDEAEIFIKKLRLNPDQANITDFIEGVKNARTGDYSFDKVYAFIASDFTPGMMEKLSQIDAEIPIDDLRYEIISSKGKIDNLAITDANAVQDTDGTLQINACVFNYGQVDRQNRMTARIDGKVQAELTSSLSAGGQQTFNFLLPIPDLSAQSLKIELHLENADNLDQDNTFYLPISIPKAKTLHVVLAGNNQREMFLPKTALDTLTAMNAGETLTVKSILLSQLTSSDLNATDILILTNVSPKLKSMTKDLQNFVASGGKIIFFAKECPTDVIEPLIKAELLPAIPRTLHYQTIQLESRPSVSNGALESGPTASALLNYKMDQIVFKGFFECQPCDQSVCIWRFQNQNGFIYLKHIGKGQSVLVNTSTDESLGMLMKSPAAVPFCRYLLGQTAMMQENKVTIGEPVTFPRESLQDSKQTSEEHLQILSPSGQELQAASSHTSFILNCSDELGFFRTLDAPFRYAGVNPNEGETNMEKPDESTLRKMLGQRFIPASGRSSAITTSNETKQYKPLWKYFAWVLIVLITAEAFITNRMQR